MMTQQVPHPDNLPRPKLSILIPTVTDRFNFLSELLKLVYSQNPELLKKTEVLINCDSRVKTIGQKRNELLQSATGEYVVFIDDDDVISHDYLTSIFKGIDLGVDHIGITMLFAPDTGLNKLVKCSKDYVWCEKDNIYYRSAQHVCPIKREIAKQVKFPEINFGEDNVYSKQINALIQTEYLVENIIYTYKYIAQK